MDYEKEYKAALERCREFYAKLGNKQLKEEVEDIFPELKESEDERMIRIIMNALTKVPYSELDGLIPDTIRIWIERKLKQGEQKPVKVPKFKIGDFIQFNGMGHTRYTIKEVCGLSHYINSFDKRMDMSYTDANFELVEQKSAEWSEDDQSNFNELSSFILETYRTEDASRLITWLKSLKDRVQPKQEWSEEDKNMLQSILDEYKSMPAEKRNWLKSLRPQSQWRPSDEQMDALETAVSSLQSTALESLYQDLKRL